MLIEGIKIREGQGTVAVRHPPGTEAYEIVGWWQVPGTPKPGERVRTRSQILEDIAYCLGGGDARSEAERLFDVIGW